MKKLLNKLLITIMIVILIFNFVLITPSKALSVGGILVKPFTSIGLLVLDTVAFFITIFVAVVSNGLIDWAQETYEEYSASEYIEDGWVNVDPGLNALETTSDIMGVGFLCIEDFFTNKLEISKINIFTDMPSGNIIENLFDGQDGNENSVINAVKLSVASWYYALRNISAVGLLCALIYTAIRILLSTVAEDKAHYKDLLMDWVKAACLVLFAHVLMIVILNISDYIVDIVSNLTDRYSIMAYVRNALIGNWDMTQILYLAMYGTLIGYTVYFTISYTKRFLYTMLLIIIAPIVSLLYAFGKDGKEIFNKWLKEFVLNAFLQPYHLIIYTVLFGFVISIAEAGTNIFIMIFALIVLHFVKDAEKYYRALFGMNAGVAGIGQVDTGMKTTEKVVEKTTKVVSAIGKVALSVAAMAIPGGAVLNGAVNATQAAQAANAANTAQDLGNIASGFGGGNPPNSDGGPFGLPGPTDGPDGGPGGPGGSGGSDNPNGGPGGGSFGLPGPTEGPDGGPGGPDDLGGGGNTFNIPNPEDLEYGENGNEGGETKNTSGQHLDVATLTAQNLESPLAEMYNMNAGDIHANDINANLANTQEAKEGMTKVEQTRMVIGGAVDAITGTNLGSTTAETWNTANREYNYRTALGEDPQEARRNAAILGLDAAINGNGNGGIYTVNGQTENNSGQGNTTDTIIDNSSLNSSATIGIEDNSTKRLEAKQETIVKPASVSGGTVTTTQGKSDKALAEMVAKTVGEMMPEMPSNLVDEIAGDVAQELKKSGMNDIDMSDFETLLKNAMEKADFQIDGESITHVENITNVTGDGTTTEAIGHLEDQSFRDSDNTSARLTEEQ